MRIVITNPVTNKKQVIPNGEGLIKLGFDKYGECVYMEYWENDVLNLAGFLPDAKHFLYFNDKK